MERSRSEYGDGDEMVAEHVEFDVDREDPEVHVAEVIAELEDIEITDLSALYDTVDHMIEYLYSSPPSPEAQVRMEFTYEGYRIVLNQDGYATFMKINKGA